jgi:hypothetical protein
MHWVRRRGALIGPLRLLYRAVVPRDGLGYLLPARLRPRVVAVESRGSTRLYVQWGRRLLGYYDVRRQRWYAGRLLRLLVDHKALEALAEDNRPHLL